MLDRAHSGAVLLQISMFQLRTTAIFYLIRDPSLSSFHFGRPFRIDSEEITVQMPFHLDHESNNDVWQQATDNANTKDAGMAVLKEWVFLCETLVPLIRKLLARYHIHPEKMD